MKIQQKHISQIRKQFVELQTLDDVVTLLNKVNTLRTHTFAQDSTITNRGENISTDSLKYYANPHLCTLRYETFTVRNQVQTGPYMHRTAILKLFCVHSILFCNV